jgi:1-acyl-sn-glycerol-3-phosphate acyltransferase
MAFKLKRFWAHILIFPVGIFYTVDYKFKPKAGKTYVYCANHTSYIDIILSYCIIEEYFVFMGKQELKKVPLFNIFFKDMNILVNRKSMTASYQAFQRAAQELKNGHSVILFPEGTISRRAPILKDFKSGAFRLAIDEQVEIIPITFENNWKFLQDKAFLQGNMRPGLAKMVVHEPISTKGMTDKDVETLKLQVQFIIAAPLKKYKEYHI